MLTNQSSECSCVINDLNRPDYMCILCFVFSFLAVCRAADRPPDGASELYTQLLQRERLELLPHFNMGF